MARIPGIIEARREAQEGSLGRLGIYIVRIEMARHRLQLAIDIANLERLLIPADKELERVIADMRSDQAEIAGQEVKT